MPVLSWGLIWEWIKKIPFWVWAILVVVIFWRVDVVNTARKERKKVTEEFEDKASRTEAAVADRRIDINKTETRSANEALEARDAERPVPAAADGVRREAADILFRTEGD